MKTGQSRPGWHYWLQQPDGRWTVVWLGGLLLIWLWNKAFLNAPALQRVEEAFVNTLLISLAVIVLALLLAWGLTLLVHFSRLRWGPLVWYPVNLLINSLRSLPQILGILIGFVWITLWMQTTTPSRFELMLMMALVISLFVFLEISDLMLERIDHFRQTDFYNAMRVCGISEMRIVNYDILFKNSLVHIFNKLIAIFGMAIFLLCSIDFIISVGLSTEVQSVNFPATLGSMLARIDSKQDILAIGTTLMRPSYLPQLFFRHLQGVTVALLIVFSLLSIYRISDGFGRRLINGS